MSTWDRTSMERIMSLVEERADAYRDFMRRQATGTPVGQQDVDDETWATFFESKLRQYPPVVLQEEETGRMFIASPFVAALEHVDGGKEVLRRYRRIRGQE